MIGYLAALLLGQQDPPLTDWVQEAERLGRVSYNAGVCAGTEMVDVTQEQVEQEAGAFQRRAIVARAWSPIVDEAFTSGIDQAKREFDVMTAGLEGLGAADRQIRQSEIEDFLVDRCVEVVQVIPGAKVPED